MLPNYGEQKVLRRRAKDLVARDYPHVHFMRIIRQVNPVGDICFFGLWGRGRAGQVVTLMVLPGQRK